MPSAVLLIIDMQEDFFRLPEVIALRPALTRSINELGDAFRARSLPVIWVRAEFAADLSDSLPEARRRNIAVAIADTPGCQLLAELHRAPSDITVLKKRYSAFFNTGLDALLDGLRPDALVVAGVNTHACVRTTVVDAYQRDHRVVLASEGVGSYDAEHDRVTRRYLDHKLATLRTNREIISGLAAGVV